HQEMESDSQPDDIRLHAAAIAQQSFLCSRIMSFSLNLSHLGFHMPKINVVRARARNDPPHNADHEVLCHEDGDGRPDEVNERIEVDFPIQKPEKGIEQEGRPMPGKGKLGTTSARRES